MIADQELPAGGRYHPPVPGAPSPAGPRPGPPPTGRGLAPRRRPSRLLVGTLAALLPVGAVGAIITSRHEQGAEGRRIDVEGSLDAFDRPDDPASLGAVPGGPRWRADEGTWGVVGNAIDVVIDRRVRRTIVDEALEGATGVGLVVDSRQPGESRFDDFRIERPGGLPVPAEP